MSDDITGVDAPNDNGGLDNPSGLDSPIAPVNDNPDGESDELARIRSALKQANAEAKQYREKLEAQQREKLVKKEEYKTLFEESEAKVAELAITAAKAERYEAALTATNEKRILQLPEDSRELVPDLPPEEKAAWLDKALPKLTRTPIPNINAGAGGAGGVPNRSDVEITQADKDAAGIASRYGRQVSAESIARRRVQKSNNK